MKKAAIDECIWQITEQLARLRRPSARLLASGLKRAEITAVEKKLPFKLPRELVALYSVCNGVRAKSGTKLDDLQVFPGFYLLSLHEAAREYARQKGAPQWRKGWLPLFANGAGDYYLVPCASGKRGVIGFIRGEPEQPVEYASVTAMFQTLAACFEQHAFLVKRGAFTIDDEKHRQIALRLNPRIALWREEANEAAEAARNAAEQQLTIKATRLLLSKKKPREALVLFEKLVALPDQAQSTYVNGLYAVICAFEAGPLAPARIKSMLKICLGQKSAHGDAHLNAAFCWMKLGERGKAIESLQKAKGKKIDLKPHLAEPLFAPLSNDARFVALKKKVGLG